MKKKVLIVIAIVVVITSIVGLIMYANYSKIKKEEHEEYIERMEKLDEEMSNAHLEPEGCIIARVVNVYADDDIYRFNMRYGYITEEDYCSYLDGETDGFLIIKHPCIEGREYAVPFSEIKSIEINRYIF